MAGLVAVIASFVFKIELILTSGNADVAPPSGFS